MPRNHNNQFTDEQIGELLSNPYVKKITRKTIRFTNEFKQYFYQQRQAEREDGFVDKREYNAFHPIKKGDGTIECRVKYLEHELAYTRQEVEFLKKLQMADMEARKQWESKHLRSKIRSHI